MSDPLSSWPPPAHAEDPLFPAAFRELLSPSPVQRSGLIYVGLFVLFVVSQFEGLKSLPGIALLVVVIAFHESGHAAGMRLFGFRDVRMFFIPFFGAAVQGKPAGAASWKQALVSLLGPLPGVALGIAGLFALGRHPSEWLFEAVRLLLLINVFNLLPFGPLDGGRLLQEVLFSRHRVLEVGFLALGSAALALLALEGGMYVLLLFAGFGLIVLPYRWRVLGAARELRRNVPGVLPDPQQLDENEAAALYSSARATLGPAAKVTARRLADTMQAILDASQRPPRWPATVALLLLYLVGTGAGVVGASAVAMSSRTPSWQPLVQQGFRVELPAAPLQVETSVQTWSGLRAVSTWRVGLAGTERYTVSSMELGKPGEGVGSPGRWIDDAIERTAAGTRLSTDESLPFQVAGGEGREVHFGRSGRAAHARFAVVGNHLYEAIASAPTWGVKQQRFLVSFQPAPPANTPEPAGGPGAGIPEPRPEPIETR